MWDFTGSRTEGLAKTIDSYAGAKIDLSPARWIWLPSERTLPNTFILFRTDVDCAGTPRSGTIELSAESRYRLWVNDCYAGFGPAPADPRWPDVDQIDITPYLQSGRNTIGIEVLYYGHGDGTWVMGKPGLIARGEVTGERRARFSTNRTWECRVDRARMPLRPKRWFLRALQEVYDARRSAPQWAGNEMEWVSALELTCPSYQPAICSDYPDYLAASSAQRPDGCFLRSRQIPPMDSSQIIEAQRLTAAKLQWSGDPEDWFDYRVPDLFSFGDPIEPGDSDFAIPESKGPRDAAIVTFDLECQVVGWPWIDVDAPEGTIIEISLQEGHNPKREKWLDTHLFRWLRYTCRSGRQRFEAFEYDSFRYLQLHIRENSGPVTVHGTGIRRRLYRYASPVAIEIGDRVLARLVDACKNTVDNATQETLVDCVGRERQQYSGDVSHEMPGFYIGAYNEYLHPRRFLRTYSEGITSFGYFMDSWPGVDRTVRIPQRMLGLTDWGPILDHSVGFVFDCYNYYFHSGDLESLVEVYPAICAFVEHLSTSLPYTEVFSVENLGVPSVWMDHDAYQKQRHKQCAYNLYVVAMLRHAYAPLADALGDGTNAKGARLMAARVLTATTKRFWSDDHGVFVANLPWLVEEDETRFCDRSLATAYLFELCPHGKQDRTLDYLVEMPPVVGRSYVPNQIWRHKAIAKGGRCDVLIGEYRATWAKMRSVLDNSTVSENWKVRPDSSDQYSHNGVVPLMILFSEIAGIRPTKVGYTEYEICPQLGDIKSLALTYHTPYGPIEFASKLRGGVHAVTVVTPEGAAGTIRVGSDAKGDASLVPESFLEEESPGESLYALPSGGRMEMTVPAVLRR